MLTVAVDVLVGPVAGDPGVQLAVAHPTLEALLVVHPTLAEHLSIVTIVLIVLSSCN